ncbi:MAG: SDR family NAD(P)-dependent oxidoreductase [Pseudobdellovibrionaceae bacterium]
MEIKDSHILITGANRGIGKAVAQICAEDKAHLHLTVRKEEPGLEKELMDLGAASVQVHQLDLSDRSAIDAFLKKYKKTDIDILFNNAGQLTGGLLETQSVDDIYQMLQVNVNALIHLTHGFLPAMLKRKKGKIINHSSAVALMNFPTASTYAASKAAVLAFTNSLKVELRGTGVSTLVLVTPGVETRMFKEIPKIFGSKLDLGFLNSIPVKKYAQMVREAILEDLDELKPSGLAGAGFLVAQHLPKVFENVVNARFKR